MLDEVHIAFAGGNGVGKISPHEHDAGLLMVAEKSSYET